MSYLKKHDASGLREGDIVRITRIAKSYEDGWPNDWDLDMDQYAGGTYVIEQDGGKFGFQLSCDTFCFPYFVLEKVGRDTSFDDDEKFVLQGEKNDL